ncbi:MAG TPA: peptide-methionine (S)-S-oxide reductase MsrA [Myxococcales bacterium]|nr:peptide-methionine (S)-S-oxide reductase MsrA [Myxococcales bacterium]
MFSSRDKMRMIRPEDALAGRSEKIPCPDTHAVSGIAMVGPWKGMSRSMFGMGCFWGAERLFWKLPGVICTQVGYAAGFTPNPSYHEVCSGMTGHTEVVRVIYDPNKISYENLIQVFWENHDPTQGMRQGNDAGTQYRSGIYCFSSAQKEAVDSSKEGFEKALEKAGYPSITTEIMPAGKFFYAEEYHQQYLHKNPKGYCGVGGTGVSCAISLGVSAD